MRLSCQKALLLLAISTIACHDLASPPAVTGRFMLNDINGRELPTYLGPTPGLPPTIVSGTLTLDESGKAVMTEHRIGSNGMETISTSIYTYKITDNQIEFDYSPPCPPNALCAVLPTGTITADGLSVQFGRFDPQAIVYNYRITAAL